MKRCPTCNRTFTDPNLSFCIDDGTPLIAVPDPGDEATRVAPSSRTNPDTPVEPYRPPEWSGPSYQSPGTAPRRKVWPWVVGVIAVLFFAVVGLAIVAAVMVPRMVRTARNANHVVENTNSNVNENVNADTRNSNLNANSNANPNANENTNTTTNENSSSEAPTDEAQVLATLTDLENEWTAANINADKKALNRILADDYVGTTPDGQSLGKAEYIKTIQRDTTTQHWDFENLKVTLKGNRATLNGIVRFQVQNKEVSFKFTDKFVWREGRWQAVGSEISQI